MPSTFVAILSISVISLISFVEFLFSDVPLFVNIDMAGL
jgi:hypothetical protein